jgi:molybdate transport system substrate-binding protein
MVVMVRQFAAALAVLLVQATPAAADNLQVIGAGSLSAAFSDLLRRFPAGPDSVAPGEFGPSGLMREKIEAGAVAPFAQADLFASADMGQARRLVLGHPERLVLHYTRNRLCAFARNSIGMLPANMLDRMLDSSVRVATSTPGADPGGDYAWAAFARAEAVHPGARAALEGKALPLVGGGDRTPLLVPGKGAVEGVFLADKADVMIGYCSGGESLLKTVQGLDAVPFPPELQVSAAYGMVLLNQKPVTLRFAAFVMSEAGQALMQSHGFDPVALAEPVQPPVGLLVQRMGQPPKLLDLAALAAIPSATQHIALATEHGNKPADWAGPMLWQLLAQSGAINPDKPSEHVRQTVRVTGADGYSVVFALAELSPQFANSPILLANRMDGAPLPNQSMRLVVPNEKRGGRSVRDVVRIDVN